MNTIPAKTILSNWRTGDEWFAGNYNMNIYKGCCHGCIYCDSRSECYGVENFDEVRAKENALTILERELNTKRKTGIVSTGAMSDPYNPYEKEYQLTRGALKLIDQYGYGIGLITKSDLVVRDLDIFSNIKQHSPAYVKLTITTFDDDLCKKIEPYVSLTSKRFEAIKALSSAGVLTGITLMPILPFINDTQENILSIVKEAHRCGAKFIYPAFGVTLRQNQRDYFYTQLDKLFPNLKNNYIKTFGNDYSCGSPHAKSLWNAFFSECNKLGLLYKMPDINALIRSQYREEQISFTL